MSVFACPECRHRSTYDPWDETVHCRRCGYTPSPMERKLARDLFPSLDLSHDAGALSVETISTMYRYLKEQFPGKIALIRRGDLLYAFGDDAQTVAEICGSDLLVRRTFRGLERPTAEMRFATHDRYVNALSKAGHEVVVVDPSRWRPLTAFKSTARATSLSAPRSPSQTGFSTFTCPACRQKFTYDPWVEPARCPRCGYTPARSGTKLLTEEPALARTKAGGVTLVCLRCKLNVPYDAGNPPVRCPWCGYRLPPLSQAASLHQIRHNVEGSRPLRDLFRMVRKDIVKPFRDAGGSSREVNIDWKLVGRYAVIGLALGALVAFGTYRLFEPIALPSGPLLSLFVFTLLGLWVIADGARMVLTREGWVKPTRYSFRRVHVTGFTAILYGLRQIFIGLLMLLAGNPLVLGMLLAALTGIEKLVP